MALMRKLWWYRQWHHDQVLEETKTEVNQTNDQGLTHWFAAGSTTLTSDIDVNLKGERTEKAVKVFNKKFKTGVPITQPWDYEAGVVYDVNVYAMDFIFDPISVEDDILLGGKEAGGFPDISTEEKEKDIVSQNIWSLVKLRLYMSEKKWKEYKKSIGIRGLEVEQKYHKYFVTLRDRMITEAAVNGDDLTLNENNTGMQQLTSISEQLAERKQVTPDELHPVAENLVIGASNRIYEDMLGSVATLRRQLRELIDVENEEAIGKKLTKLRNKLSEAAFFANEAYVTDAAVTQTVVGIQGKKDIRQPMFELMSAVNENLADALKEMTRHSGSLGEAAFKSAKYIFRMTEAAKSMGIKGGQVKTFNVVSSKISKEIKGTTEEERASSASWSFCGARPAQWLRSRVC